MKIYQKIFVVFCVLFVANCSADEPATQPGGPTEVLNNFVEASKTKDIESMKRGLSKGTIDRIEKFAAKQKTTIDELLKEEDGTLVRQLPETRSEKINGEKATLEVKNIESGEFEEIPFVKEGGTWRLAIDQIVEENQEENEEETSEQPVGEKTPDSNTSNSSANPQSNNNSSDSVNNPANNTANNPAANKN